VLYVKYLKRIPVDIVKKLSVPELMELVRERMSEKIEDIPDHQIVGVGNQYYPFFFFYMLIHFLGIWWFFFR
jgi:hypothetical protein